MTTSGRSTKPLKLKSTTVTLNTISRELAWRKIVRRWRYSLEHLPAEMNDEADILSRLKSVPARPFPRMLSKVATYIVPPRQTAKLWKALISYD